MLFGSLLLLAVCPAYLYAQEVQLPTVEIKVHQDLVPQAVKEAALKDFGEGHKPIVWVTTQSLFSTYEWAQSTNIENMEVSDYGIHTKTNNGSSLDAIYTPDGKLINSREYLKNFRPSLNIMLALQKTEFKDWGLNKDFRVRKISFNGSERERYALVLKKGNKKKTILLDANGRILANQQGEHVELADADF